MINKRLKVRNNNNNFVFALVQNECTKIMQIKSVYLQMLTLNHLQIMSDQDLETKLLQFFHAGRGPNIFLKGHILSPGMAFEAHAFFHPKS